MCYSRNEKITAKNILTVMKKIQESTPNLPAEDIMAGRSKTQKPLHRGLGIEVRLPYRSQSWLPGT
jgi:hypothetical protein